MEKKQLETFLELIETRNFNRAADRLGVSQSTVSSRMRALEAAVGASLFERGRSGATPTPMGLRFEAHARNLNACWDHARRDVGVSASYDHLLRIAGQFSLMKPVLVNWLTELRAKSSELAIELQANYSDQIVRDISSGLTDIGVLYSPRYLPDLHIQQEGVEIFVMVSTTAVTLSDVDVGSYIFTGYTDFFNQCHRLLLPEHSRSAVSVGYEELAIELLKRSGGATYLPKRMISEVFDVLPNLLLVEDAPEITQPIFSAVHSRQRHTRHVVRALEFLRKHL